MWLSAGLVPPEDRISGAAGQLVRTLSVCHSPP